MSTPHLESQPELEVPHANTYEDLRTNGLRVNRCKQFDLPLSGQEIYDLTQILRETALDSAHARNWEMLRKLVISHEVIFQRAKMKGF